MEAEASFKVRGYEAIEQAEPLGNPSSSISLIDRLAAGEVTIDGVDAAQAELVAGNYLTGVRADYVETCGDGRSAQDQDSGRGQMFGGTLALAKDLFLGGSTQFGATDDKLIDRMASFCQWRVDNQQPVGNHIDDHARGPNSGCGEQDGAPAAFGLIVGEESGVKVHQVAHDLLTAIDDAPQGDTSALFMAIQDRANQAIDKQLLPTGAEVRDITIELCGESALETLVDKHNELYWIINTIDGSTFDRTKFQSVFPGIDAFNEDQWLIEAELKRLAPNAECEYDDARYAELRFANMVRRVATALNLTKDVRILILK